MVNSCGRLLVQLAVVLWPVCAGAQTVTTSFADLMGTLRAGQRIVVTDMAGHNLKGTLTAIDDNSLSLSTGGGIHIFAKSEIKTIRLPDGVSDGALVGAGVGVGAALGLLGLLGARDGYVLPSAKLGAPLLLSGVGAAVGVLVDRAHDGGRVLYISP